MRALLDRQGSELARLVETSSRWTLSALEDARRALRELLAVPRPLRVLLALLDGWTLDLRQRLGRELDASAREAHAAVGRHLVAIVRRAEPELLAQGQLERLILAELAQLHVLALHRAPAATLSAQTGEQVQRWVVGGMKPRAIAGPQGPVSRQRARADLTARMSAAQAYNDGYLEALKALNRIDPRPDDPLMKRIDEWIDHRNHPFSRVADGTTALLDEPFRVSVADVADEAASMKTRASGVLWPVESGHYVGQSLPAHYHDRGRITAWRASWDS